MKIWIKRQHNLCLCSRLRDKRKNLFLTICHDMINATRKDRGLPELKNFQEVEGTAFVFFKDDPRHDELVDFIYERMGI